MLRARVVPGRPKWRSLFELIAPRPGAMALWSGFSGAPSYLACEPLAEVCALDPEPELELRPDRTTLTSAPRWFGLLPYESMRSEERRAFSVQPDPRPAPHHLQPRWRRYGAVVVHTPRETLVVGDQPRAVEELGALLCRGMGVPVAAPVVEPLPLEAPELHAARITRAIELIRAGDLYQVNLARRLDFRVTGDALGLFQPLCQRAPADFSLAWRGGIGSADVVATSPELFLRLNPDGRLLTRPIKGTARRGSDAAEDAGLRSALDADPKERAELSMVVDVERNDLGRVAETGSVRLVGQPRILRERTLFHREATVAARLEHGIGRAQLLEAMLPSGSVTGAPKIRAMEVISQLESTRRGLYTGAFGLLTHAGGLELGMAIRTATVLGEQGHFHVGGGIVADSDVAREVAETDLKAIQLLSLLDSAAASRFVGLPVEGGRNLAC